MLMKVTLKLLACFYFCGMQRGSLVRAVRLAEQLDDFAEPSLSHKNATKTEKAKNDPKKVESELQLWLDQHELDSAKVPKLDGDVDDGKWAYMNSECFQQRYNAVAKEVLKRHCNVVIEVGGYLTPLDGFLLNASKDGKHGKHHSFPKTYINIDASMKKAKVTAKDGLVSYHLPMTISDFVGQDVTHMRSKKGLGFSRKDSCAVIFGIWDPHVKQKKDSTAMQNLLSGVHFAAIETSAYSKNWLEMTTNIGQTAGLRQAEDIDVDCTQVPGLVGQHEASTLLRHMRYLSSNKEGKKAKAKESPPI